MKFFEQHFTTHHLLRAPHKWFLAFLISPIHFGEQHYKQRYHLQFKHARKLFLFDISLVASCIVIFFTGIFWWMYDPTITDLVYVSINPSKTRIVSGEEITYTIGYENDSNVEMEQVKLRIDLPHGFVFSKVESLKNFDASSRVFFIDTLLPKEKGFVSITGLLYGTSDKETPLQALLEYSQKETKRIEKKLSPHIIIVRGSLLKTNVTAPQSIVDQTTFPISIHIENTATVSFPSISIPIVLPAGISLNELTPDKGLIEHNVWNVGTLEPNEKATLTADITANFSGLPKENTKTISITPSIIINGSLIDQETKNIVFGVVHPHVSLRAEWQNNATILSPNETGSLTLYITNDGMISLSNARIEIPAQSSIINTDQFARQNNGTIIQENLVLKSEEHAQLSYIEPGKTVSLVINVPVRSLPQGGNDIQLSISPHITAVVDNTTSRYIASTESPRVSIGTQLTLQAEARYYTNGGDQLGRGPLPPEVGKETRYGIITTLYNSSSEIKKLIYTAKLPDYVRWTGVTSVSHGAQLTYHASTHEVSWGLLALPAYHTVQLYFELGLTPDQNQQGTYPVLVQTMSLTAFDNFIKRDLLRTFSPINTSLDNDTIAKQKGDLQVQ